MTVTSAFIFARGGSKGLPRKNVLPLSGIPLIAHSINTAVNHHLVDHIYVSTDSDEISSISYEYGAQVIQRPPALATDTAPEWLAWQHAISYVFSRGQSFDRFISLPPTAPLRSAEDVQNCLDALSDDVDFVLTMSPASRNPWFNMVTQDNNKIVSLVAGDGLVKRRQDAPICFDISTVAYVSRPEFILNSSSIWEGTVVGVEVPRFRSIDIDDELDLSFARFLMEETNYD